MKRIAHRIGAVLYFFWGVLHVVGGAALLLAATGSGAEGMFRMMDNGAGATGVPSIPPGIADGVAAFHAFNLLWIGLLVLVIAITMNWKNNQTGYWLNLVLVGMADIGLLVFLVLPGYMPVSDALPGPVLWAAAWFFATLGLAGGSPPNSRGTQQIRRVVPA